MTWEVESSVKAHLDALNKILEEPRDKHGFIRSFASSSTMEDDNILKGSRDALNEVEEYHSESLIEMGSFKFVDILSEILLELKELKKIQLQQAEYMIGLEMDMIKTRKTIQRKGRRNA